MPPELGQLLQLCLQQQQALQQHFLAFNEGVWSSTATAAALTGGSGVIGATAHPQATAASLVTPDAWPLQQHACCCELLRAWAALLASLLWRWLLLCRHLCQLLLLLLQEQQMLVLLWLGLRVCSSVERSGEAL